MKPNWDDLVSAMQDAVTAWRPLVPSLPSSFTTNNGVTVAVGDLTHSLEMALVQLKMVASSPAADPVAVVHVEANLRSLIPGIVSAVDQMRNGNNPAHINQLLSHLWSLKNQLPWMSPLSAAPGLESTVAEIDLRATAASLQELLETCRAGSSDVTSMASQVRTALEQSKEMEAAIESHSRLAGAAKISTESAASTASAARDEIVVSLNELNTALTKLSQQQGNVDAMLEKASTSVALAAKDGLAKSFAIRQGQLFRGSMGFAFAFAVGILGLTASGVVLLLGWAGIPPLFQAGAIEPAALLTRLMVLGPLLWLTWFSSRQYGVLSRLEEDYAFKKASALAYVGYRDEMSDDPEMIKLLKESAIRNFASTPTRLLDKSNPSTPAHELIDKALTKDGVLDKLLDRLKDAFPRLR